MVDAYNAVGLRNPKWDAPAVKFLEDMGRYFTFDPAERPYKPADVPTRDQLWDLSRAAISKGCNDPMVLYCRGVLFHLALNYDEAEPLMARVVDGLKRQGYSPYRISAAAERWAKLIALRGGSEQKIAKANQVAFDAAVASLSGEIDPRDLR